MFQECLSLLQVKAIIYVMASVLAIVAGLVRVDAAVYPSWGSWCMPKNGLLIWVWVLLPLLGLAPDCEACSALVKAISKAVGLSSFWICIFSATAPSSFAHRSLIWEDWALIFCSCLSWDTESDPNRRNGNGLSRCFGRVLASSKD